MIRNICKTLAVVALVGLFVGSGYRLFSHEKEMQADTAVFDELRALAMVEENSSVGAAAGAIEAESEPFAAGTEPVAAGSPQDAEKDAETATGSRTVAKSALDKRAPARNLSALKAQNPDTYAWIYVPGTPMDYPVMHTPDAPDKYFKLSFYGNRSSSGTPYMYEGCDKDSDLLILYGHRMRNGAMFAALSNYTKSWYAAERDTAHLYVDDEVRSYQYITTVKFEGSGAHFPLYEYVSQDEKGRKGFMELINGASVTAVKEGLKESSQYLFLITCDYDIANGRVGVLYGRE